MTKKCVLLVAATESTAESAADNFLEGNEVAARLVKGAQAKATKAGALGIGVVTREAFAELIESSPGAEEVAAWLAARSPRAKDADV